jgi:hypothetical protein
MFEYLFPIFCFGVVVTGIVVKGLIMAADMANTQISLEEEVNAQSDSHQVNAHSVSEFSSLTPTGNNRDRLSQLDPSPQD